MDDVVRNKKNLSNVYIIYDVIYIFIDIRHINLSILHFRRDNAVSHVDKIDYEEVYGEVGQCPTCKQLSSLADFGRENLINKPCDRCGTIIKIIPYSQRL